VSLLSESDFTTVSTPLGAFGRTESNGAFTLPNDGRARPDRSPRRLALDDGESPALTLELPVP
jgi:hypothetical protein